MPWVNNLHTVDQEATYLEYAVHKIMQGRLYLANIVIDDQIVGQVEIHNISANNHRGEVGYWLDSEFQGRGIMTYAVRQVINYAFEELHLHRLELITDVANEASQQVARRLGWKKEAYLSDYLISGDGYQDAVLFCKINHQQV
ncbi:GNAT family N-acetyltransferase [Periweissella fabalis]|uniref:GNAT family N-acetyltransferase n=1 Tax=Periweissella fabalis TaxID=1070421 RepID=A0A7X6N058_9LACO|nr:GNAT family protein [Periweissella fabalis]MCM0599089.1 GNAT family N-acetyltransferase [Periweissella fabalis]NKZ23368.1 GNAT family N-acetyltransferase [Periweissella fabalis]